MAGQRRLELFGEDRNIRPGWVTVGRDLTSSNFDPQVHAALGCMTRPTRSSRCRADLLSICSSSIAWQLCTDLRLAA